MDQINYLPLPLPFFALLLGAFVVLGATLAAGLLRYVSLSLGMTPLAVLGVLLLSLVGSYFNLPIAQFPERQIVAPQEVPFFGMHYVIPQVVDWPGTIIAVNVGGALVPLALSIYLVARSRQWLRTLVAVVLVTIICHWLAYPVPGLGIAIPIFVPPLAAACVALLLARRRAAALAYVSGSIGTLIGADLLNLGKIEGLGAPVASIGGAGTFDGIFVTGILAVLLAGLPGQILHSTRA